MRGQEDRDANQFLHDVHNPVAIGRAHPSRRIELLEGLGNTGVKAVAGQACVAGDW